MFPWFPVPSTTPSAPANPTPEPGGATEPLTGLGLSGIFDQPCPACGVTGAYIGFKEIECHNSHCVHWSPRWHADYQVLLHEELDRQKKAAKKTAEAARAMMSETFDLGWSPTEDVTQEDLDLLLDMSFGGGPSSTHSGKTTP